jgi:hypothetical protein
VRHVTVPVYERSEYSGTGQGPPVSGASRLFYISSLIGGGATPKAHEVTIRSAYVNIACLNAGMRSRARNERATMPE